jgi:hypothetical protein
MHSTTTTTKNGTTLLYRTSAQQIENGQNLGKVHIFNATGCPYIVHFICWFH